MPRYTKHKGSAKDTHNYYLADYYKAGSQLRMQWLDSIGCRLLGLHGNVDSKQFMDLLENRHPFTGKQLTPRMRGEDRVNGWDLNFNVPKSVSLAFALNNDADIAEALKGAVVDTALEMEQDVKVRDNSNGQGQTHKKTGNFVAALQIHVDARGVGDQPPDPNIHAHLFVGNITHDGNRFMAADIPDLYHSQGYYEAVFQSRLATRLQHQLGHQVERTENNFEITGISRELIDKFSKRSTQINDKIAKGYAEKLATDLGISLDDAKGMVGALTRDAKQAHSLDELKKAWHEQVTPEERKQLDAVEQRRGRVAPPSESRAKQAVDFALEHGFSHEAVLEERHVLRDALKFSIGHNTVEEVRDELAGRNLIRQGKDETAILTTKALQEEELAILNFARDGRGSVKPIDPNHQIQRDWMSQEQAKATKELLVSADRVQIVLAAAGTGKTSTVMRESIDAMEASGRRVAVLAPTNKAAHEVLRDDGFHASTIASFLLDEKAQQKFKSGVIWVDETGLVDNPTMAAIFSVAQKLDARVVLSGDTKQHSPVGRGNPSLLLEQHVLKPKQVTKIFRQEDAPYRQAVEHLAKHEIAEGFTLLRDQKRVHELPSGSVHRQLANDYADALLAYKPKQLLVTAATHAERRTVTDVLRETLKDRQLIRDHDRSVKTTISKVLGNTTPQEPNFPKQLASKLHDSKAVRGSKTSLAAAITAAIKSDRTDPQSTIYQQLKDKDLIRDSEHEFTSYTSKQLTPAQRSDPLRYASGDLVAYHSKADGGIAAGDQFTVTKVTKDKVFAGEKQLPIHSTGGFNVFQPETANYAVGDTIRLTRGRRAKNGSKQLNNGGLHAIKSIRGDVITLDNGEKLGADHRFFTNGLVVTSHVSQGTTVKRSFVSASMLSFPASSPEQAYVSSSRARKRVDIYTDSVEGLERAISRSRPKLFATSVTPEQQAKQAQPTRQQRPGRLNRLKQIAHAYATKQMRRFAQLLQPDRQLEPQFER